MVTLGPSSSDTKTLCQLLTAGMDVARVNFSHGNYESYRRLLDKLSSASAQTGLRVAKLMDTRGPEIRIGTFATEGGVVHLKAGDTFTFYSHHVEGDATQVTIMSWTLWSHVKVGDVLVLDYGTIYATVTRVATRAIETRIENSATLGSRKHVVVREVNVLKGNTARPDGAVVTGGHPRGGETVAASSSKFRTSLLSYKDTQDIAFAVKHDFDFIAVSYCAQAEDIDEVRSLPGVVESGVKLLAKIDTLAAIAALPGLLESADGIMLCRSEIALHMPIEQVSTLQKSVIRACNIAGKPVVVINHILYTMASNPSCTRSEASDVANMVLDGADCLALTNPTATGQYGVSSLTALRRICHEAECAALAEQEYVLMREARDNIGEEHKLIHSLASSAVKTAYDVQSPVIIVFTESGTAATTVASYRPHCPVIAVTTSEKVARQLMITRSIRPFVVGAMDRTDDVVEYIIEKLRNLKVVASGDLVVHSSGAIQQSEAFASHFLAVYLVN